MTTIEQTGIDQAARPVVFGDGTAGSFFAAVADWATSTDHKKIGRLYAGFGLLGLVGIAVIGALLGLERTDDAANVIDGGALLQLFQLHRFGLVFLVAVPLTLGLAIAVVPMQVGARSLAFARLALTGFYLWLGGAVLTVVSLGLNGGFNGGNVQMIDLYLAAHGLAILGILASAGSVATTVLTSRAPGMSLRRVPFFTWSALVQAIGLIVALPVMFGAVIFMFVDHRNAQIAFGGGVELGNWVAPFLSQPMTYIYALPALGLLAEMLPVAFGKRHPLRQVVFAGVALVGIAALAGVTRQATFPVDFGGASADIVPDLVVLAFFLGLPLLGAVITLLIGAMVAKPGPEKIRPRITSPLLFSFFGAGMVIVGMAGTVLNAIVDLDLAGTVLEEGATVYVTYGAALAMLGGLVFWSPKLWGPQVAEKKVLPLALLGVLATILASLPHYIAGFTGQTAAAGIYDGDGSSTVLNGLVLVGHALMALTVLGVVGAIASSRGDDDPGLNPWCAHTLEWSLPSPAPAHNWTAVATVRSAEPELDQTPSTEGSPS